MNDVGVIQCRSIGAMLQLMAERLLTVSRVLIQPPYDEQPASVQRVVTGYSQGSPPQ